MKNVKMKMALLASLLIGLSILVPWLVKLIKSKKTEQMIRRNSPETFDPSSFE